MASKKRKANPATIVHVPREAPKSPPPLVVDVTGAYVKVPGLSPEGMQLLEGASALLEHAREFFGKVAVAAAAQRRRARRR